MAIKGFIEGLTPNEVWGWAMESRDPEETLLVELRQGNTVLACAKADRPHAGLFASGVGSGRYAFRLRLNPARSSAELIQLTVRAITQDARDAMLPRYIAPATTNAPPPVPADASANGSAAGESHPVFVLGCPRSGTSAIALALATRTRFKSVGHEGHIIDLLSPLYRAIDRFYRAKADILSNPNNMMMIREVPRRYFEDGIATLFKDMAARLAPDEYWLDKTPTPQMIRAAPTSAEIWPNAKFIFMRRRGFENLASQRRKFAGISFEDQCESWIDCMFAWQQVSPALRGRAVELDQHFLSRQPAKAAAVIGGLLGLDAAEQTRVAGALDLQRPERTDSVQDRVYDAMPADWTAQEREIFNRLCRPYFAQFGYADDGRYYLDGGEEPGWRLI